MGRTIPTANMLIQEEIDSFLRTYGRGLSGEKERLRDIMQTSKRHTQACGQAVRLVPFHAILMSLILEQQKQLNHLIDEIASMSKRREEAKMTRTM
jgi:hypothetical protein